MTAKVTSASSARHNAVEFGHHGILAGAGKRGVDHGPPSQSPACQAGHHHHRTTPPPVVVTTRTARRGFAIGRAPIGSGDTSSEGFRAYIDARTVE
jgi:hypothetical protein